MLAALGPGTRSFAASLRCRSWSARTLRATSTFGARLREGRNVRGAVAPEAQRDHRALGRKHFACGHLRAVHPREAGEQRAVRDVAVLHDAVQLRDRVHADRARADLAHRGARESELAFDAGRVEVLSQLRGRVAELRVPRPEVRADSVGLVGVATGFAVGPPPPRPHGRDIHLRRDLAGCQRLPLDHAEPLLARAQALAPARPGRALEAEHQADPRDGDADLDEPCDAASQPGAQSAIREQRPLRRERPTVEVDLRHDVGDGGDGTPPRRGLVGPGERRGADQQERPRTARRERAHEPEDVVAILRVVRRPGRLEVRPVQLVERDPRRRALGLRRGEHEEAVGALLDRRRIERLGRRADARAEIHVPVDGLGALGAEARGVLAGRGRGDDPRSRKHALDLGGAEVDPDGGAVGQPARPRECGGGKGKREQRDDKCPHRDRV